VPSEGCAKGGAGAYTTALKRDDRDPTGGGSRGAWRAGCPRERTPHAPLADPPCGARLSTPQAQTPSRPPPLHPPAPAGIAGLSRGLVSASAFRTYHTALNAQAQFIGALSAARAFASDASEALGLDVFPYSVFHVFFEQYLTPGRDAVAMVGLPALAVVGVAWAFTSSAWGAGLLLLMLASLLVQLGGAMYLAGIQVNAGAAAGRCDGGAAGPVGGGAPRAEGGWKRRAAVELAGPDSIGLAAAGLAQANPHPHRHTPPTHQPPPPVSLVNLAMALGIAVEFNAHILHSFCVTPGTRPARARAALVKMGAPVTTGITLTKFAGVVVLAFARTQIFEVYYFRLYLALVILGAAHGLVLLPIVLSRFGPPSWNEVAAAAAAGGGRGGSRGSRGRRGGGPREEVEFEASASFGQAAAGGAAPVDSGAFGSVLASSSSIGGGGGAKPAPHDAAASALPALAAAGAAAAAAALEEQEHDAAAAAAAGGGDLGDSEGGGEGMEMSSAAVGAAGGGGGAGDEA
jgi:hypothetical protein